MSNAREEINAIVKRKSYKNESYAANYKKLFIRFFKKHKMCRPKSLVNYKTILDYIEELEMIPELLHEARIFFEHNTLEPQELIEKRAIQSKIRVGNELQEIEKKRLAAEEFDKKHFRSITLQEIADYFNGTIIDIDESDL